MQQNYNHLMIIQQRRIIICKIIIKQSRQSNQYKLHVNCPSNDNVQKSKFTGKISMKGKVKLMKDQQFPSSCKTAGR